MCYTQFASAVLATIMFAVAAYEYKQFRCVRYSLGLSYFGAMELLQAVQHSFLARPEDGYQMCRSKTNQFLTWIGLVHICFQPFFFNYLMMGLYRFISLRDRIESEYIVRLTLLGGCWLLGGYTLAYLQPEWSAPAISSPMCPNDNWLREGFDAALNFTTPNVVGLPCTYLSPTENGHLAWVFPSPPGTYYSPTSSTHAFMMFACHLVLWPTRPLIAINTFICFLTGPMLARYLSPSINEQASIWCFNSVIQACLLAYRFRKNGVADEFRGGSTTTEHSLVVMEGTWQEPSLMYVQATGTLDEVEKKLMLGQNGEKSVGNGVAVGGPRNKKD